MGSGLNCKHKPVAYQNCGNEKAFISLDSYIKTQASVQTYLPIYPTGILLKAIDFDSFKSFAQVDSLKKYYCREELYGIIPLKFVFNSDTLLLSAFPFACNVFPDKSSQIINVTLTGNDVNFHIGNSIIGVNESQLKDSLKFEFITTFKKYFERQYEINEKVKDTNEAKQISKSIRPVYSIAFVIRVQDDTLIKNLRLPIEIILTTYLSTLEDCLKKYYKKEICELTAFELKLFSSNFFLNFEIQKMQS